MIVIPLEAITTPSFLISHNLTWQLYKLVRWGVTELALNGKP